MIRVVGRRLFGRSFVPRETLQYLSQASGIVSAEIVVAGALIASTSYLIGSPGDVGSSIVGGNLSSGLIQETGIDEGSVSSLGEVIAAAMVIQSGGISEGAVSSGGAVSGGAALLLGGGILSAEAVGTGGELAFNVAFTISDAIPITEAVGGGALIIDLSKCQAPLITIPAAFANESAEDLAIAHDLPAAAFRSLKNQVPSHLLERHYRSIASALGIDPDELRARVHFEKRRFVGRTASPPSTAFKGLKQR